MSSKISVIIITKNASKIIKRSLESVKWADEIVVVDVKSTDDTKDIVKQYTHNIFDFTKDINFVEPVRNFAISKASNEWILLLDADEEVSPGLKDNIRTLLSKNVDVYDVPRKNIIFNKWVKAGMWPDYQRRLFRKGHLEWSDTIHAIPVVKGSVKKLDPVEKNCIIHHHYQSIEQYIERLNSYTSIEASQKKGQNTSVEKTLKEGFSEFQKRFYSEGGYGESMHGLGLSFLQMFYQVAVQLKVWQNQGFKSVDSSIDNTVDTIIKELKYWHASYKVSTTKNPIKKIYWRIRRKFYL
jgi:glycosyltransferase involved in cell wall biosynthesis